VRAKVPSEDTGNARAGEDVCASLKHCSLLIDCQPKGSNSRDISTTIRIVFDVQNRGGRQWRVTSSETFRHQSRVRHQAQCLGVMIQDNRQRLNRAYHMATQAPQQRTSSPPRRHLLLKVFRDSKALHHRSKHIQTRAIQWGLQLPPINRAGQL
jgi:hypothetical protein